ncbi:MULTISPECIES: protein arginine kinase [Bacillales]|uniref:protein arginine kinase n=1 Tax=Bacillales TaxID=1385 RepID=UPI000178A969|nr:MULTISPECIES: protein arginine kinase [Paenibacillus]ACX67986.1 ATP:guanido phosphotransferase [Paenibacillus sp. Y412MC10]EGG33236.1 ATP:guanido phosphotransferase, C-terminal catalytic domain protein [Paenibacillus sp. HGF5]MCM3262243.1 protein arginine kinase [Paenibacillus lautus]PCL89423.1 protein arginine kinase [Paenibacillus lautus]WFB58084.1 protein arginine kinase [Paenibacillus sp. BR1-192]
MSNLRFTDSALSEWMRGNGQDSDIVISTRVRVARNLQHLPFPLLATDQQSGEVLERLTHVLKDKEDLQDFGHLHVIKLSEIDELDKKVLVEKHLISPNLANESRNGAVILTEDESVSIMINEEDHLRIQCLYPGFQVREAWSRATALDDIFESEIDYAFDDKRGYLTSCPTNVGTGLRASVMMHLPALVMTQQINRILSAVSQVGLTVRGIYGEGSEALGNLFQISNQITLGQTESEIIENLHSVALQIIEHEKNARARLLSESKLRITDRVMRSYGILSYAAVMDSKEAAQRLSDVRLGVDLGLLEGPEIPVMNELNVKTQPGFLQKTYGEGMNPSERDMYRAKLIRETLGNR